MVNVRISEKTKILLDHAQRYLAVLDGTTPTFGEVIEECVKTWLNTGLEVSQEEDEEPHIREMAIEISMDLELALA